MDYAAIAQMALQAMQAAEASKDKKKQERRQKLLDAKSNREDAINLGLLKDAKADRSVGRANTLGSMARSYLDRRNTGLG